MALVQDSGADPFSGALYVFRSAMVLAARAETAKLLAAKAGPEARIDRLHAPLKTLERARYGGGRRRLIPISTRSPSKRSRPASAPPKRSSTRSLRPFEHGDHGHARNCRRISRVEVVSNPRRPAALAARASESNIGEDVSERLDVIPAKLRVIVTHRRRYACAACREGVAQAPVPAHWQGRPGILRESHISSSARRPRRQARRALRSPDRAAPSLRRQSR